MTTLVLGIFSEVANFVDALRQHLDEPVLHLDAAALLGHTPVPPADLTILVVAPPRTASEDYDDIVSPAVAVAAWDAAARTAVSNLQGRQVLVIDTADLEQATADTRTTLGLDVAESAFGIAPPPTSHYSDVPADTQALHRAITSVAGLNKALSDIKLPSREPVGEALASEFLVSLQSSARQDDIFERAIAAVAALTRKREIPWTAPDPYAPRYGPNAAEDVAGYQAWLRNHGDKHDREQRDIAEALRSLSDRPTLAVVVPVYKPDLEMLERCVASVTSQAYDRWELCLCDDQSDESDVDTRLQEFSQDPRIRVTRRSANGGISAATNDAVALSSADFLVFLDQDDELAAGALAHIAQAVVDRPDVDVIYTDEDKIDLAGSRSEPHFKPDWSPDLLLSQMYMGHLLVVRRALFDRLGGLRSDYDGSQDFDLALRATEQARRIVHVPRVSYHWRKLEGSSALDYRAKPYADVAARAAITDALRRRGQDAAVEDGLCEGTFRVRRTIPTAPLVSIVVPFRDGASMLRKCIDSLHTTAGYDHWEVLLVDNRSWEPETVALTQQLGLHPQYRLLEYDNDFNWSAINNWAARQASGDVLLFLNSDVEGSREGWLTALVEHAIRPEVGVVGARLLYPHGTVQHGGVVLGMGGGVAWHAFCHAPASHPGYFAQAKVIRNYCAVTGACMMIRREVFEDVGCFDESLAVGFSDVDLCIKVHERGLSIVYTPFAELIHYESATRGRAEFEAVETVELFRRWAPKIRNDPYFNPNLDIHRSDFGIAPGAEEVDKWAHVLSLAERSLNSSGTRSA